jgi:hypothetical protein
MANYVPVCLASFARTWLLRLPAGSVHSWNHLCWLFTSNFHAICAHPRVDWDLASIIQKKVESLREFIQHFCNKRNITTEVDDKSIVMFFRKGLRETLGHQKQCLPSLASMPWPKRRPSTPGNRRRRRTHATWTSLAHPRAMIRRGKRIVPPKWWNDHDATRSTGPGRVKLKASWIASAFSTPSESTRPGTVTNSKVSQMKYSRWPNGPIRRKSLTNPRATSPKLTRRSTTSMVASILMSQGESRNSQPGRSWRSDPLPPSTLSGTRSTTPSTAVTTQTLYQS